MKIGIVPINVGYTAPEQIVAVAEKAESVGVESVWTFEHVIVPVDYESRYPYSRGGKMPTTPETNFVDPLIALTHVAARTTKLRLGTGVNILPQTNPLLAAKQVASIDFLSGGRMMYGVGVGWLREEFDAMGTPFERRGARCNEYIEAMKKFWVGEVVDHEGEFLTWKGFKSRPAPVQKPHLPLIIGGTSKPAYRRAAKYGDGWIAPNFSSEQLAGQLQELHAACEAIDRDPASIEVTAMWRYDKDPGGDTISEFEKLGVTRLLVPVFALGGEGPIAGLERLGSEIIAKL